MNESRQKFLDAINILIRYIEQVDYRKVLTMPIGFLDYDGDPGAKLIEAHALWTTLVCVFGNSSIDDPRYGYITEVVPAYEFLKMLRDVITNGQEQN